MEKLLQKDAKFQWIEECQESLHKLKSIMATSSILVFPDWKKDFHFHVDTSSVTLSIVMTQTSEGVIDVGGGKSRIIATFVGSTKIPS